ncbi:unnamed protein product [Sympodiomycopsis kandeliae]
MTTPDIRGLGEDVGMIEVYGASISTFTRTITLALHHLKLPFVFHQHAPHSAEIKKHNPLGLVPVFIHRPNPLFEPSNSLVLYESSAIRRYIDDALSPIARIRSGTQTPLLNPELELTDSSHLFESSRKRATLDQIISLANTQVFPSLQFRLIKPRLAMEENKADEATIKVGLEEGVQQGRSILALMESFLKENEAEKSEWFVGNRISWADLYLYPIFADLKSIPEGPEMLNETPLLKAWVDRFEATAIAKATYPGSIPDKRSKSASS